MQPDDRPLMEHLTAEGRDLAPVLFRLFQEPDTSVSSRLRLAESDWYHAPTFACIGFGKPISRCRRYDEP